MFIQKAGRKNLQKKNKSKNLDEEIEEDFD